MRRFIVAAIASLVVAAFAAVPAGADSTGNRGQPTQSCEDPGSLQVQGFGSPGFLHAKTVYADPSIVPSGNIHAVSQYDVACFQLTRRSG